MRKSTRTLALARREREDIARGFVGLRANGRVDIFFVSFARKKNERLPQPGEPLVKSEVRYRQYQI